MNKIKIFALSLIVLVVLYVAFFFIFLDLVVDYWWFSSLDFRGYFWLRLLYQYFILGIAILFFFAIFFLHFWIASRLLGADKISNNEKSNLNKQEPEKFLTKFRRSAMEIYGPLSAVFAIIIALPLYHHWEDVLLYFFAPSTGIDDPVFQHDTRFYMFSFPIYQLIQKELLSIAVLLFCAVGLLYWMEHRFSARRTAQYPTGAKIHLAILALFVVFFIVWQFFLDRFSLLYFDNHEPVFFGPGFVEIRYKLPLIWLSVITFIFVVIFLFQLILSRGAKSKKPLFAALICFFIVLGLRADRFIPGLLERFVVRPNPVKAEKPFMANNINATLTAYGIDSVKTIEFVPSLKPLDEILKWEGKKYLDNVPLWDRELLKDVYYQLQGLRPYYKFIEVDEDRYSVDQTLRQVNLAARELNIEKLPKEAHTWENKHLRYTHGYGAVMTPAAQPGDVPQDWYLRDLNMLSKVGFTPKNPEIYYGLEDYRYIIVPNALNIVGISGGDKSEDDYRGSGGIPIQSLFRKLLFAFYFAEEKIFFSLNIRDTSRVRFRRNIIERIETLTPFLSLDDDPYLVATPQGFFWIQDAYTLSDWYPVSKRSTENFRTRGKFEKRRFNYIRNSVKIVVDAYDGKTWFYIVDREDPIIQAYHRAYPGLFLQLEDIPEHLVSHLRYPRDIFYEQMKIYRRYHQIEPELFYQQAETWEFPYFEEKVMKPYFLTTNLQGCGDLDDFVQIAPMSPIGRDNLSGLAVAGTLNPEQCGSNYFPTIVVFKIKKDIQLDGPPQISALIDQDPKISEQITLWDQHGSKVVRGRMIILPVGNTILYVQPIYLISTQTTIPELKRVIVASGGEVIMAKSSATAFQDLEVALGKEPEPKPKPVIPPPAKLKVEAKPLPIPTPQPERTPPKKTTTLKFIMAGDISFDFGKALIKPAAENKLMEIAEIIKRHETTKIKVKGYTDSRGRPDYNLRLSEHRAEAVKQWLIGVGGIHADLIESEGLGNTNPIAVNRFPDGKDNPEGRAKNRRVEIVLETIETDSAS